MNIAYLIYQAERPRTAAELRDEAIRNGEFAKALSGVLRGFRRTGRAGRTASPAHPALTLVRGAAARTADSACMVSAGECRPAC